MQEPVKKNQGPKMAEKNLTPFQVYFRANLLFFGFLVVLAVISYFTCGAIWDDVTQGVMEFIFLILGGGFLLVSYLDYLYEKHIAPRSDENPEVSGQTGKPKVTG